VVIPDAVVRDKRQDRWRKMNEVGDVV